MIKCIRTTASTIVVLAALSACGGGGGGGGVREVPFTSFSAIGGGQTAVMTGISETVSGTRDPSGIVTPNPSVLDTANSTARLTYDGNRNLSQISFSTPQVSGSFGGVSCSDGVCGAATATGFVIAIDAPFIGWDYQSFGVWLNTSPTTFQVGAMSAGAATPGNLVPFDGTASFLGLASGFYVDQFGQPFSTVALMNADVNFTDRKIAFTTTEPDLINLNSGSTSTGTGLNLLGTLSYDAGSSQFSGTVNSGSGGLNGTANGKFYGPSAQEIGGVYSLSGLGKMIGAFGGRRLP
jgi:hypothetical protein